MILVLECIVTCLLFGGGITISVLVNKTMWLQDYSPAVRQCFIECNPDYVPKERKESNTALVIKKVIACILFLVILTGLVYLAGANTFMSGFIESYVIWLVVNWFDVFVLDWGIFMYWKRIRLPGTEDMDEEYKSNKLYHVKGGVFGTVLGLPVCLLVGVLIAAL